MNAYRTQIRMNLRLTLRNRMALFFGYFFPLMLFVIFGQFFPGGAAGGAQLVNMVLSIGVLGSGLFGVGMRSVMDREQNILRRFKVAPIGPGPILISQMAVGLVFYLPFLTLMLVLGHQFYGMPWPAQPVSLLLFVALGLLAFSSIGSIVAAVVNSMQENQLVIQLLYFPMLFLSGITFPMAGMPAWLQTLSQFIPMTYFASGLQPILRGRETILDNLSAAGALALTAVVATFLALKLFRWEKEEKMRPSAKLWVLAVLVPFLLMGAWELHAKNNVVKARVLDRDLRRSRAFLIRDARLFVGDGTVVDRGSVLIREGKIAGIYAGPAPDPKTEKAEAIDAAGKTLLPGLIDVHVHLAAPGGLYEKAEDYARFDQNIGRELAAYLFSGVTAVKSLGDPAAAVSRYRSAIASGERLGAELFAGPLLTSPGTRESQLLQYLPPQSATPAGAPQQPAGLPAVYSTGEARDVAAALDAKVSGIEHGSSRDAIPDAVFARMKEMGVSYDPALAAVEAAGAISTGKTDLLERSLVEQVGPPELLQQTRKMLASPALAAARAKAAASPLPLDVAKQNLAAAHHAGVSLVTGTDSGNPLVIHGPAIHRELQIWVQAGVPPAAALQAATHNAAALLQAADRIGMIGKGYEASLLLVDGNPLQEISATERISEVFFKGERLNRAGLLAKE